MRITGIATKVRAGALALSTVLALALSLLSGWSAGAIAAPHAAAVATHKFATVPHTPHSVSSNQYTYETPGMAAFGDIYSGTLYVGYAGTDDPSHIYITDSNFSFETKIANELVLNGTGVGMCAFKNRPYVVWAGTTHNLNIGYYNNSNALANKYTLNQTTNSTPSCTVAPTGYLLIAWVGVGNDHINIAESPDGTHWSPPGVQSDTAIAGIGITSSTDLFGQNGDVVVAWPGTDNPHHINWSDFQGRAGTDWGNYTNNDVETTQCCVYGGLLYITFQAATSTTMFYETWDLDGNHARYTVPYQTFTGIGIAAWGQYIYFAWGDPNGHLNVAQILHG